MFERLPTITAGFAVLIGGARLLARRYPPAARVARAAATAEPLVQAAQSTYGARVDAVTPPVLASVLSAAAFALPGLLSIAPPAVSGIDPDLDAGNPADRLRDVDDDIEPIAPASATDASSTAPASATDASSTAPASATDASSTP